MEKQKYENLSIIIFTTPENEQLWAKIIPKCFIWTDCHLAALDRIISFHHRKKERVLNLCETSEKITVFAHPQTEIIIDSMSEIDLKLPANLPLSDGGFRIRLSSYNYICREKGIKAVMDVKKALFGDLESGI